MTDLRIGLIGAGVMGAGHAKYLTHFIPGAHVAAICEPRLDISEKLAHDLRISPSLWTDAEQMLESEQMDGVIIASPDQFHAWTVRHCLDRGIPALCEKPLAENVTDARDIHHSHSQWEEEHGKPLIHLGFMRRFDAAYQQAKALIDSGEMGNVLYVNASTRNVTSEGITSSQLLTNIAVHEIDVMRWLLGTEWSNLTVNYPRSTVNTGPGVRDPIVLTGSLQNSVFVVADIFANNSYGYDVRTEITCEAGVIRIGTFGDVAVTRHHTSVLERGGEMDANWIPRFENAYISELQAWTGTLRGEESDDLATVPDGLAAIEVLDALVASQS